MPGSRFSEMMAVNGAALRCIPMPRRPQADKVVPSALNFIKPAPKPVKRTKPRKSSNDELQVRDDRRSSALGTAQEKQADVKSQIEQSKQPLNVEELEAALKDILGE